MILALAGNQNCGKTTLFNLLTGANQHVGNFPGVTVEKKSGSLLRVDDCTVVDLPGLYSLRPYSEEEAAARDFLLDAMPDGIINILDASNLERNLYLTLQLMTLQIPMVLALNMMDEVHGNGGDIAVTTLSERLGVPVIPISALKNEGIDALCAAAIRAARMQLCPASPAGARMPEGGAAARAAVRREAESTPEQYAVFAQRRYRAIADICRGCVTAGRTSREYRRSVCIDRILTGKYTALPAFCGIMLGMFYLTFPVLGGFFSRWMGTGIRGLALGTEQVLLRCDVSPVVRSLVIDGLFAGVGSVLSFLPMILTLFFFLSVLEDTGYLARVAFVLDKPLRRVGLSGRSIVPLLIGFGCTVPAVMATRTLTSRRDRRLTLWLTPYMSCSAKIPVYAMLTAAFFPQHKALVTLGLYLLGILCGLLAAFVLNRTLLQSSPAPLVMELPNYRFPSLRGVGMLLWEKAWDFLRRAFTVILLASLLVWALQTLDLRLHLASDGASSLLCAIGTCLVPVFAPLGIGDWRICAALLTGFAAKESVVSTLWLLLDGAALSAVCSPRACLSLLTFILLYSPCVAAIAAVRRELSSGWQALGFALAQTGAAWLAAFAVYLIAGLFL